MYRVVGGLVVGLLCLPSAALGILIETNGERVGGFLVRDDGKTLTVRVRSRDGKEKDVEYSHAKVKILSQLDAKRLGKLSPDDPKAYRDYAKQLAATDGDPEARYVAMRLYLIAAHLDPKALGPGCLLAMSPLAETAADARKCRAMAYLLDASADAKVLQAEAKAEEPARPDAALLREFVKPLQHFRKGNVKDAAEAGSGANLGPVFGMAPGKISQRSFLQWCADANCTACKTKGKVTCTECDGKGVVAGTFGGSERCPTCKGAKTITCAACDGTGVDFRPTAEARRSVLEAEVWALARLSGEDAPARQSSRGSGWSSVLQARQVRPVSLLALETITEFDPRKCYYRNGKWVARP